MGQKKFIKKFAVLLLTLVSLVCSLTACTDYCDYGGCMRKATSGGRCSEHAGLKNNPYYGMPN